jgi:hypothetical protein
MSIYNVQSIKLSNAFAMGRFAEPQRASASHQPRNTSPLLIGSVHSALDSSHTLAGLLLAASMAALMVVAGQVIDTWTDGHLLAGWVALWTVVFAALALLASHLRRMAAFLAAGFMRRLAEARAAREEARMWEMARHDPRVMDEIYAAMLRQAE